MEGRPPFNFQLSAEGNLSCVGICRAANAALHQQIEACRQAGRGTKVCSEVANQEKKAV